MTDRLRQIDWAGLAWKLLACVIGSWAISVAMVDATCIWAHDHYEAALEMRNVLWAVVGIVCLPFVVFRPDMGCITMPIILALFSFASVRGYELGLEHADDYEVYSVAVVLGWSAVMVLICVIVGIWWNARVRS